MTYANFDDEVYYFKLGAEECGDITVGLDEKDENELEISPNPTEGLSLRCENEQ